MLSKLLADIPAKLIQGDWEEEIVDFHFDSRRILPQTAFIAIKGTALDGHEFIEKAIKSGAKAIIFEDRPTSFEEGMTYLEVENARRALALMAANYYGNPAQKMKVVGVTGTNGKTTTASLLHQAFQGLGITSGLFSTILYRVGEEEYPSSHTTPDPKQLHQLFAEMVEKGCEYCFMEVSSHALAQHRTAGIPFHLAMFTNLTHDHLDYHGSFKAYLEAKKMLFDGLSKEATALVNVDDRNGRVMVQNTAAQVRTYALKKMADYRAKLLENTFEGLRMEVDGEEVWFQMRGSFNAYNLLMVYAAAIELGLEKEEILKELSAIGGVPGRFEVIRASGQRTGIVDYAHTPDALENILSTIQDINRGENKVLTIVGCGGNRDKEKRPMMAKIAAEYSDRVILTSDNPRNENPEAIVDDMYVGIPYAKKAKVIKILNREEAIKTASALAGEGDIILLAGKGHETYQEIKGIKHPFDDRVELRKALALE